MVRHSPAWFKPGRIIKVNDKMQTYEYKLSALPGKNFAHGFNPHYSPGEILKLGAFEGKYLNDCHDEFPREWFKNAKVSEEKADPSINLFGIKSRLSLKEWKRRKWIKGPDVRGWFQWYCRYWIGRRDPELDAHQIARWRSFRRHAGQIRASIQRMKPQQRPKTREELKKHRPRQRQALLQWAYDPWVVPI